MLLGPLVFEQGEIYFAAPSALPPLVGDEMRLPAHPETVRQTKRGRIAFENPGSYTVKTKLVEGEVQHRVGGLRGVSVTGVIRMEYPADLAAPMCGAMEEQDQIRRSSVRSLPVRPRESGHRPRR